jgi:flagellar basal body rod protein FlgG
MADIIAQVGSSIDALMREFDTITHNLANVSTAGYKRRCNAFSKSLLKSQGGAAKPASPGGVDLNSSFDFSQGGIVKTDRLLDFALYGRGFFVIETPEGALYTRNGAFHTNQNGQIVNSEGNAVAGEAGPITIPTSVALSELSVSSDGSISAGGTTIGKFKLVDFEDNENKLAPSGASCFHMPGGIEPVAAEHVVVKQGCQEVSNVRMIDELVDMIMVCRLYEANMKFVSAKKQISGSIISVAMG